MGRMPETARPSDTFRPAFAPSLLAAIALFAGIGLIGNPWYLVIQFVVAILAIIVAWYAWQAAQWWWTIVFALIAIVWNPVFPLPFEGLGWVIAHVAVAGLFAVAGALLRVPRPPQRETPRRRR